MENMLTSKTKVIRKNNNDRGLERTSQTDTFTAMGAAAHGNMLVSRIVEQRSWRMAVLPLSVIYPNIGPSPQAQYPPRR